VDTVIVQRDHCCIVVCLSNKIASLVCRYALTSPAHQPVAFNLINHWISIIYWTVLTILTINRPLDHPYHQSSTRPSLPSIIHWTILTINHLLDHHYHHCHQSTIGSQSSTGPSLPSLPSIVHWTSITHWTSACLHKQGPLAGRKADRPRHRC